jgi:hypothetical protein
MKNELIQYTRGNQMVPMRERKVAKQGKDTYDAVRLAALKADGAMALGGHIMQGLLALDEHRRSLSCGDPIIDVMLMEVEANTIRQVKGIQSGLFDSWGL